MKKIKKFTLILVSMILCCSVFASCGINSGGGGSSSNVVDVIMDNKDKDYLQKMITDFEKSQSTYKVNPIWTAGGDIHKNQAQKIGTKTAPDVIVGGDMYTEVYKRNLLDLNDYIARDSKDVNLDDFVEGIMPNLKDSKGRTLFMPRFFNISLLYYNKTLFDASKENLLKANITPAPEGTPENEKHYPHVNWTIEDYFKAGGMLTKMSGDNYTQWGSSSVSGWWGEWLIHLRQAGIDIFDETGHVTFNNPKAKKAMEILVDKAYGSQERSRPKIGVAPGQADLAGFQGKKTAMDYGGHTANWSRFDTMPDLKWGVTVLPTGIERRKGAEFATEGYGIFKDSNCKEGAWEFIKFMTSEAGIKAGTDAGYVTVRKSVYDSMEAGVKKDRTKLALDAINPAGPYGDYAMTLPKYEYFSEIATGIIESELSLMVARATDSSKITIDQAIANIEKKANDYIDLNYV